MIINKLAGTATNVTNRLVHQSDRLSAWSASVCCFFIAPIMLSSDNHTVDIDLCRQCYGLAPSEHNVYKHEFNHLMVSRSMWLHPLRKAWIKLRMDVVKMHLAEKIKTNIPRLSSFDRNDRNDPEGGFEGDGTYGSNNSSVIGVCARCAARIVDWNSQFYVCGEYSCTKEGRCHI